MCNHDAASVVQHDAEWVILARVPGGLVSPTARASS
jgi:hypothetical protein